MANNKSEINVQYVIFDKKIDKFCPNVKDIEELEAKLQEAKICYRESEGKRILQGILADSTAPSSLKEYIVARKIESLSFKDLWFSSDYMPDWEHIIEFKSYETTYTFVMDCSESFMENYPDDTGTCYFSDDDLFNSLFDDFSQDFIDKFDKEAVWAYLTSEVYAPNWREMLLA